MPQTASQAQIAYDWEMWIGRTSGQTVTWTQVLGLEALPFPEQVPEDVDVTHMQSPGRTRETMPGLLPVADWSQEKQMWPESAGDILIETLAGLTAEGTPEDVLVEFHIPFEGAAVRRTYTSYINSYTPTGTVGEKAMATLSVKVKARSATNPRVIS